MFNIDKRDLCELKSRKGNAEKFLTNQLISLCASALVIQQRKK